VNDGLTTATASQTVNIGGGPGPSPQTIAIASSVGTDSLAASQAKIVFPVTLSQPSAVPLSVQWTAHADGKPNGASAAEDFIAKSGTLTFKPSTKTGLTPTTKYVTVKLVPDGNALEADETFTVTLSNPTGGYELARSTAEGTIVETTPMSSFTAQPATIFEGDTGTKNVARLVVRLGQAQSSTTSVMVSVAGGSATPGLDYKSLKPKVPTFKPGQVQKTVAVAVAPDAVEESDETIALTLSNAVGGPSISTPIVHVTVVDDDNTQPATPAVIAADPRDAPIEHTIAFRREIPVRSQSRRQEFK
jgi:hypothetical protein